MPPSSVFDLMWRSFFRYVWLLLLFFHVHFSALADSMIPFKVGTDGKSSVDSDQKPCATLGDDFNHPSKIPPLEHDLQKCTLLDIPDVAEFYHDIIPERNPYSPLVNCSFLPEDFLICDDPVDLNGNQSAFEVNRCGCYRYGGQRWEDVQTTAVVCRVLPGIECYGRRIFLRDGYPCVKFTGHFFLSTLLYSVLLGFAGIDRFCLGHTCMGVGKILTIGGCGVWWFVDVVLLLTGNLLPEDGSNWMPYY